VPHIPELAWLDPMLELELELELETRLRQKLEVAEWELVLEP